MKRTSRDMNDPYSKLPRAVSSVHDITQEKPPFGSRFLTEGQDVWSQNAWDHVPPPDDQEEVIANALAKQHLAPVPEEDKPKYNEKPAKFWDNFYKNNAANFFRDRKWRVRYKKPGLMKNNLTIVTRLHFEFPELTDAAEPEAGPVTIAEIGCGAGNSVFPLLASNQNPELRLFAYDYSSHAVKVVQSNPLYTSPPVGSISAAVWDLSSPTLPPGLTPGSVDLIILVFVLSALHPDEWAQAIKNIHQLLKPGGRVLFRDYGRYDLTQLRFKGGRLLDENFYIRGDKTRVYFFEIGMGVAPHTTAVPNPFVDELALLFTGLPAPLAIRNAKSDIRVEEQTDEGGDTPDAGSPARVASPAPAPTPSLAPHSPSPQPSAEASGSKDSLLQPPENKSPESFGASKGPDESRVHPNLRPLLQKSSPQPPHPLFTIDQLGVDRRLIVNRKRQLKMYRVWMQAKFRKAGSES
ncbi:methyltransferase [Panus rudis PR-1116 ss-1]|nr:methyltransferase [Panus rudis PR-1116 ss-1]